MSLMLADISAQAQNQRLNTLKRQAIRRVTWKHYDKQDFRSIRILKMEEETCQNISNG